MSERERVVVIGTGPAAAAAAVILSQAGREPLLLEAGSEHARLGLTARVRGLTVAKLRPALARRSDLTMTGDPKAELFEELAPGGLSNHWAQISAAPACSAISIVWITTTPIARPLAAV